MVNGVRDSKTECVVVWTAEQGNTSSLTIQSAAFKKHQLVEPFKNLQENICSQHDELICSLCSLDEHKGHETVSAAAERKKKQKKLEVSRLRSSRESRTDRKDVELLQQELEAIRVSADKTVEDSQEMFTQIDPSPPNRRRDVEQADQIPAEDGREDDGCSLSEPEPETRDGFLKYSREITLDPNTAHRELLLSEGNRKVTRMEEDQRYPDHPDRFSFLASVLSKESLTGRCYWEVELRGGGVCVSVAKKNISRKGDSYEFVFGRNDKSWSLDCDTNSYKFWYNRIQTPVSGPQSSRIGVYLDHRAGILSFYSVSETMTLLHRVQTTFTEPIHAGVYVYTGTTAEFLKSNRVIPESEGRFMFSPDLN
ncbi:LOW QUALITY PROTEIN: E3 ubiquitin/ISG15 ligase TRIM25-like [Acanthochromis polyacanthus]|uniref:LOW QUALITY PROTEIN: E3 ubiquitin/ISG15 ligase TRIM25-like n=1 Tax=Acanthochromis polyacanthus TaxID=80966 RepID=UPI002234C8A4|nr:LOW QUALITY PROTEIN: E3 ubiquitin/ISG15 ligase TRIM25-like [Acanthochromis polyacanthus]